MEKNVIFSSSNPLSTLGDGAIIKKDTTTIASPVSQPVGVPSKADNSVPSDGGSSTAAAAPASTPIGQEEEDRRKTTSPTKAPSPSPTKKNNNIDNNEDNPALRIPTLTPTTKVVTEPPKPSPTVKPSPVITFPPQEPVAASDFKIHPPKSNAGLSTKEEQFVQTYCDMTSVDNWYPDGKDGWQQRAPYFVLAGVWNSGIQNLATALHQHPQIPSNAIKSRDFFLPREFYEFQSKAKDQNEELASTIWHTNVQKARSEMYSGVYSKKHIRETNQTVVAMDVSPGYLFHAERVSQAIQCVSPWAKVVLLLRDPVERTYRQWVYAHKQHRLRMSLEEWMTVELNLLKHVGFGSSSNHTTEAEQRAWKKYQERRGMSGVVARSVYVIQLEEWVATIKAAGKNPKDVIYIVSAEQLDQQPQQEYAKLIQFLGLADYHPSSTTITTASSSSNNLAPMKEETRKLLQGFYAPYNKRLQTLLTQEFGMDSSIPWIANWS